MTWSDALEDLAKMNVSFSLSYDVGYGIDKRSGWTLTIRGIVVNQFATTPDAAVFYRIIKEAADR